MEPDRKPESKMTNETATPAADIKEIAKAIDGANVEIKLYEFTSGRYIGKRAVRYFDLDSENVIGITVYPSHASALAAYDAAVAKAFDVVVVL
jgi:hypothetical protein